MSVFYIHTGDGRVATRRQLAHAGVLDDSGEPTRPWHPIQGPRDASTMWYSVLRKREHGVFIGTLSIRHTGRPASLVEAGWEEVALTAIGPEAEPPAQAI
jgi:hypothetical protein